MAGGGAASAGGYGGLRTTDLGERLSGESSCIGVLGTRIACFGVEADEQFASQCDADDHFFFSRGEQPGAEVAEAFVVPRGDGPDEEQDRAYAGASAADRPLALSLTAPILDL